MGEESRQPKDVFLAGFWASVLSLLVPRPDTSPPHCPRPGRPHPPSGLARTEVQGGPTPGPCGTPAPTHRSELRKPPDESVSSLRSGRTPQQPCGGAWTEPPAYGSRLLATVTPAWRVPAQGTQESISEPPPPHPPLLLSKEGTGVPGVLPPPGEGRPPAACRSPLKQCTKAKVYLR